jgi:hypothetical protein
MRWYQLLNYTLDNGVVSSGIPGVLWSEYSGELSFTLNHAFQYGGEPDEISKRPALYLDYVRELAYCLREKFGLKGTDGNVNMFVFSYIADKNNNTDHYDNDEIFNAEINILEGKKQFMVNSDHGNAVKNYLKARNATHDKQYQSQTVTVEHHKINSDGSDTVTYETKTVAYEQ